MFYCCSQISVKIQETQTRIVIPELDAAELGVLGTTDYGPSNSSHWPHITESVVRYTSTNGRRMMDDRDSIPGVTADSNIAVH